MKTFLITTDFSANSKHAAAYGYALAKQLKAGIILYNTVIIPAEAPLAGLVVWPMEESNALLDDSSEELKKLKAHLEINDHTETFRPTIRFANEAGIVNEMINNIISNRGVDLVIAGTHQHDGLTTLLLGNHIHSMIDTCTRPLLIVPHDAAFKQIKKIAFATDFINPKEDLDCLYRLITLARPLNAEVLLTHVHDEKYSRMEFQLWVKEFMAEVSNKANYPNIYYRPIKSVHAEDGLDWLCEHGQIDMLAMIHRPHGFFDNLFNGSHTRKMVSHISIPLLVLPGIKH
jgi:nucleotide-binding universal stress UspA family protein